MIKVFIFHIFSYFHFLWLLYLPFEPILYWSCCCLTRALMFMPILLPPTPIWLAFWELVAGRAPDSFLPPGWFCCSVELFCAILFVPRATGFVFLLAIVFLFTGFSSFFLILWSCFSINLSWSPSASRTASIFHSLGLRPFLIFRLNMSKQTLSYIVWISSLTSKSPSFSFVSGMQNSSKLSCFIRSVSCWPGTLSPSIVPANIASASLACFSA